MRTDVTIRTERPEEFGEINEMVRRSFAEGTPYSDGSAEVVLIGEIRESSWYVPGLSFVAELDGDIVGHALFSRFPLSATYEAGPVPSDREQVDLVLMAPVAVHPHYFRQGIGTSMLSQALELVRTHHPYVGVLVEGDPKYYHRFGFATSTGFGILPGTTCIYPKEHPECMMVLERSPGSLTDVTGYVNYHMYPSLGEG